MGLTLRYAARSHVGLLRDGNEDSGYAGPRLLAVADGMGGHAAGEVASAVAIATVARLDDDSPGADPLDRLAAAVRGANAQLRDMVSGDPDLGGMGTTLTALLRAGSRLALLHIGDSRGYLLRDGVLSQITRDHTFVQTLIDEGRISEAEADHHPQRSLILRALDGRDEVQPDLSIREGRLGDRYLICSDGLSGVVSEQTLKESLAEADTPEAAVDQLVDLALRGGGPDNITAIVADVVATNSGPPSSPQTVGAAAADAPSRPLPSASPAGRAAALVPPDEEEVSLLDDEDEPPRWGTRLFLLALVLAMLGAGAFAGWTWAQRQYYVGADDDRVAIFRGLPEDLGPIETSTLHEQKDITLKDLPDYQRDRVNADIPARSLSDAERIVATLREQAEFCRSATATPTPTHAATSTSTPSPSPSASPEPASPSPTGTATVQPPRSPGQPRGCGNQ